MIRKNVKRSEIRAYICNLKVINKETVENHHIIALVQLYQTHHIGLQSSMGMDRNYDVSKMVGNIFTAVFEIFHTVVIGILYIGNLVCI